MNLSRADFDACDMVEEIRKRVDNAGIPRNKITIEITESIIGSDFEFMKAQVKRFRELGFPVWMDDFGSGYSSLDVLQSIPFDLIKFDMSFMQKLEEGNNSRIVLTELMKMATALNVDTICEGVETESQVRFLQEIGCSKLQGYYYTKPVPLETILERHEKGTQIGFENQAESEYYEMIGRVNLYDLAVLTTEDADIFHNIFDTQPMGILEVKDGRVRFVRSNPSCREFMKRFFDFDLTKETAAYSASLFGQESGFMKLVNRCCQDGNLSFFDEKMKDGSTVHSFARRISTNPVTGTTAVAIAVLSITDEKEGASYADIARTLAADYYNLYYVNLETEEFIEYSSPIGEEELAMERHGKHFFEAARRDTMTRIYEADRDEFLTKFTRESILKELDTQGVFTATYRLVNDGSPMYVSMKVMRIETDGKHIIIGISGIDSQMKQKASEERLRQERLVFGRVAALSGSYIVLYTVDLQTDRYYEYSATEDYRSLGLAKEGDDFFGHSRINGAHVLYAQDLPYYLRLFTKENILNTVRANTVFTMHYRLMIKEEPVPVSLRAALVQESDGEKLIVGVGRDSSPLQRQTD